MSRGISYRFADKSGCANSTTKLPSQTAQTWIDALALYAWVRHRFRLPPAPPRRRSLPVLESESRLWPESPRQSVEYPRLEKPLFPGHQALVMGHRPLRLVKHEGNNEDRSVNSVKTLNIRPTSFFISWPETHLQCHPSWRLPCEFLRRPFYERSWISFAWNSSPVTWARYGSSWGGYEGT